MRKIKRIFFKDQCIFDYDDLFTIQNAKEYLEKQNLKPMINCPNCGAPITGSKCEYCGTVFE